MVCPIELEVYSIPRVLKNADHLHPVKRKMNSKLEFIGMVQEVR